ncbi:MAG: hypothetical protein U1F13_05895 [Acinetobacter parvus]
MNWRDIAQWNQIDPTREVLSKSICISMMQNRKLTPPEQWAQSQKAMWCSQGMI